MEEFVVYKGDPLVATGVRRALEASLWRATIMRQHNGELVVISRAGFTATDRRILEMLTGAAIAAMSFAWGNPPAPIATRLPVSNHLTTLEPEEGKEN